MRTKDGRRRSKGASKRHALDCQPSSAAKKLPAITVPTWILATLNECLAHGRLGTAQPLGSDLPHRVQVDSLPLPAEPVDLRSWVASPVVAKTGFLGNASQKWLQRQHTQQEFVQKGKLNAHTKAVHKKESTKHKTVWFVIVYPTTNVHPTRTQVHTHMRTNTDLSIPTSAQDARDYFSNFSSRIKHQTCQRLTASQK